MGAVLTALLALHGAIHLLGFLKWSRLARVPRMSGRLLVPLSVAGERMFAAGWLLATGLLVGAAILRSLRQEGFQSGLPDSWWILGLAGVLLSQVLIVLAWPDAKAGTAANLILLLPIVAAAAHARFEARVGGEAAALLAQAHDDRRVVTPDELRKLPAPVATWLERSGVVGRPRAATVRLHQRGEIRTKVDAPWMPALAEQDFSIDPPGFVWRVDATMMGALPISGRDRYAGGRGEMLIKAASIVNVVKAADQAIDLGAMLRYLAEIIWFPSAALGPHVSWEPMDATHARATMRDAGRAVSAVFTFDQHGRAVRFDAERPLGGGQDARLTPWFGASSEWRAFDGIEVPVRGEVGWQLAAGPFIYYRWQILDVEFNRGQGGSTKPVGSGR
jgi:hypothetical protein